MYDEMTEKKGLNKAVLQTIAIIAMVIDHCSVFVGNPLVHYFMKLIGKITVVIMCYFVAEGFYKTRDLGRYIIRMGAFALISQIPYYLFSHWSGLPSSFKYLIFDMFNYRNVIFTLFVGLCLLTVLKSELNLIVKMLAIASSFFLVRNSDWSYYVLLWIVGFGLLHGKRTKQIMWLIIVIALRLIVVTVPIVRTVISTGELQYVTLFWWISQFGLFLSIPLLLSYNGEKGKMVKYGFYLFYQIHFLIIYAIIKIIT